MPRPGKVSILWLDCGYIEPKGFRNLLAAMTHAQARGESASFHQGDEVLAVWDPVGGYKWFHTAGIEETLSTTNIAPRSPIGQLVATQSRLSLSIASRTPRSTTSKPGRDQEVLTKKSSFRRWTAKNAI